VSPFKIRLSEKGKIKDIKNIIVRLSGLSACLNGQILELGRDVKGIVMGFDEEDVLALVLGDESRLRMGQEVSGISEPFTIPVSERFLGRTLNALCEPCDGAGVITADEHLSVFRESLPITARSPVTEFLHSGTKIVDVLIPLGKGQRQLIIGDRVTGKTCVAVDAMLNQKERNVVCIYCCIGKAVSALEKVVNVLNKAGALGYTIVMAATDNAPAGEQYLVPFSAATIGEFFARKGRDVLVVFDDLTKHAWAYRQLSLLLERPPGREAYPGDIFYVQTQLMERAGRFNEEHGGGSMSFLGIVETLQGDLTSYIPSNLISMADGQIFLSSSLFAEGQRPAIDFGMSVSIIGGKAQPLVLRKLSAGLRAEYQQYMELVKLSRLQTGLSQEAERILKKGEAVLSVLQQGQYQPVSLAQEVALLYALNQGWLQDLSPEQKVRFREEVFPFVRERDAALVGQIEERGALDTVSERRLNELLAECIASIKAGQ
jgi:F-type H+-transporting ATPase subunit alpha